MVQIEKSAVPRRSFNRKKRILFFTAIMIIFLVAYLPMQVEARGKKKKKGGGGGEAAPPTCESLGLDCSATCCDVDNSVCRVMILDCAKITLRPF